MNPYKEIFKQNLPRLLSLYNIDSCSMTYGFGDRLHWGWKISDFANGTMQGGVHSLAVALKLGLLKNEKFALKLIYSAIRAIDKIRARNGSLAESYPSEHSFCVTALVAFDALYSLFHLRDSMEREMFSEGLAIIRPLINFITKHDEEHAVISNHLATAAAAIILWKLLSNEKSQRDKELLQIIYQEQSNEGWYREYEGADPGYQTLCTYYLFCAYELSKNKNLLDSLLRTRNFLSYFVHPDGTIGGLYGSRNSEVYYPAGIVGLAPLSEDFAMMAAHLQRGIEKGHHILPQSIDTFNFVTLLNSYAVASLQYDKNNKYIQRAENKAPYKEIFEKKFPSAGIYIRSTKSYYAIINYQKGGTIKVFDKKNGTIDIDDGGIFGKLKGGKRFSTQQVDKSIAFNDNCINACFYITNEAYPSPIIFFLLRLFCLTAFRFCFLSNIFKKFVIRKLITRKKRIDGHVVRNFEFLEDEITIRECIIKPKGCHLIGHFGKCKAIHMASSGYYHMQDLQRHFKPSLTKFDLLENDEGK